MDKRAELAHDVATMPDTIRRLEVDRSVLIRNRGMAERCANAASSARWRDMALEDMRLCDEGIERLDSAITTYRRTYERALAAHRRLEARRREAEHRERQRAACNRRVRINMFVRVPRVRSGAKSVAVRTAPSRPSAKTTATGDPGDGEPPAARWRGSSSAENAGPGGAP